MCRDMKLIADSFACLKSAVGCVVGHNIGCGRGEKVLQGQDRLWRGVGHELCSCWDYGWFGHDVVVAVAVAL